MHLLKMKNAFVKSASCYINIITNIITDIEKKNIKNIMGVPFIK